MLYASRSKGAEFMLKKVIQPAIKRLAQHEDPDVRDAPEALVRLVLWHAYPGARDFLAALTQQLKASSKWSETKTVQHREYGGKMQLEREFNPVIKTCQFSKDGLRIECALGLDCRRAKRLRQTGPYSLKMPSSKTTDPDGAWSVRNWRQKNGGLGGCTLECFPMVEPAYDEAAAAAAASTARTAKKGLMDAFAKPTSSFVPTAAAALAISASRGEFTKELERLKQFDMTTLVADFCDTYGPDGPTFGEVSKPKLNAGISMIDELASEMGRKKDVLPSGNCSVHVNADCPADCPVHTLKGWRKKLMRATKAS